MPGGRHNGGSHVDAVVVGGITIGHFEYLALMAACLLITVPLELVLGARVYRRFRLLVLALFPVVVIFSIWDVVGILREHWDYNPAYVTGVQLVFGMPLEELVFFIVIPICGLLTYEAVGQVLTRGRRLAARRRGAREASDA
jgi:lycopene cyclase domain-containing protein